MTTRYMTGTAPRTMFHASTGLNPMLRGPMVTYAPEDEGGTGTTEEDEGETGEETTSEGSADDAVSGGAADDKIDDKKSKPSDAEAKLLREAMKHKKAAKTAQEALDAANRALEAYKGADPAKVQALIEAEAQAERTALEAKGEYERILAQVNEQHAAALTAKDTEVAATRSQLEEANRQIDELTIGAAFGNSKFLTEKTILTPAKARKLFGDHFDRVDGKTVAYDKPKGAGERTPLVDASGDPLSFEAAIEKIVSGDEDFERFSRSKLKPGGSSSAASEKIEDKPKGTTATGTSRIAANLGKLIPTKAK